MALIELEYEERADGLLYPIIDIGESRLRQLGKFGNARLDYLHSEKFEMYRELLLTGKLAEHCEGYDEKGDEMYEVLFQKYLKQNPPPSGEDFFERLAVFEQADKWADEIVLEQIVYNNI